MKWSEEQHILDRMEIFRLRWYGDMKGIQENGPKGRPRNWLIKGECKKERLVLGSRADTNDNDDEWLLQPNISVYVLWLQCGLQ